MREFDRMDWWTVILVAGTLLALVVLRRVYGI